jgi:hypothetical protein
MIFQNEHKQNFKLVHTYLRYDELNFPERDQIWWDTCAHEGYQIAIEKMKAEILDPNIGLKYPICVKYMEDGSYHVEHGGKRYEACKQLKLEKVNCLIMYREKHWDKIKEPDKIIQSFDRLCEIHNNHIERIFMTNSTFMIWVYDRKNWFADDFKKRNS